MDSKLSVGIIGTGIGGTEIAGYLGLAGHDVRAHDIAETAVSAIRARGGIDVEGVASGFAPIRSATTDLAEAIEGADLVIVATLHNDYGAVARALGPVVADGQAVCLMPGYVGGAAEIQHSLATLGCHADIALGEVDSFPFTGRINGATLHLTSIKQRLQVATLPGSQVQAMVDVMRVAFPQVVPAPTVLHTGFASMNPMLHVPGMIANASRIDRGDEFEFYGDGISPAVAQLIEALDAERVAVAAAFGVKVDSQTEWLAGSYGLREGGLYARIQALHRTIFKSSLAPTTLDHRYLTEDVPYGLVPILEFGRIASVPTPVTEALTLAACNLLGRDFTQEGRTLRQMGLEGLSAEAIKARLS